MPLLFIFLFAVAGAAHAEVYRCKVGNQSVFSDSPCAGDAKPAQLPEINVVPREEIVAPKRKPVATTTPAAASADTAPSPNPEVKSPAKKKADADWVKRHKAQKQKEDRVRKGRIAGKIVNGMTAKQVRDILGKPDSVTREDKGGIIKERWTYKNDDGIQTVRLRNGEVDSTTQKSTIQE